ncbi:helix-turn-helix transcriptional regulator, partial [Lysobacter sp. D1-1-M9]|uniref:helix-turn-helix transcriptional regulator n=1 Tax=Novilysobacter longmucuonensis TaxID=3098603 RepID=UPI002FCB43DE
KRLKKAGLTRSDISKACGVSRHAVGFWETGRSVPNGKSMAALVRLANEKGIVLLAADFAANDELEAA